VTVFHIACLLQYQQLWSLGCCSSSSSNMVEQKPWILMLLRLLHMQLLLVLLLLLMAHLYQLLLQSVVCWLWQVRPTCSQISGSCAC
jgi:hypothetical protein